MDNRDNARTWKVGDILDATFHYSMSIPAFYIVVKRTASTIWAEKIGRKVASCDRWGQSGMMVPDLDKRTGHVEMHRISKNGTARFNDSWTKKWDGRPVDFYGD